MGCGVPAWVAIGVTPPATQAAAACPYGAIAQALPFNVKLVGRLLVPL